MRNSLLNSNNQQQQHPTNQYMLSLGAPTGQASNYASNGVMGAPNNLGFTGIGNGGSGNISLGGGAHHSESLKAHAF